MARLLPFFMLLPLSLTFFRPEVPLKKDDKQFIGELNYKGIELPGS